MRVGGVAVPLLNLLDAFQRPLAHLVSFAIPLILAAKPPSAKSNVRLRHILLGTPKSSEAFRLYAARINGTDLYQPILRTKVSR
jgi:hypothetical protein